LLSAALLQRWPQVCRIKITYTKLPTNHFVSTTKNSMKCVVNWIPLRICVRSRNTQPHLKGGPEPLEKEVNEILGSKRKDRLLDPFFELVQKTTLVRFSYLLRLGKSLFVKKEDKVLEVVLQRHVASDHG